VSLGSILTELGHGLVSWGLGGDAADAAAAQDEPGTIVLPRVAVLNLLDLPDVATLCEIALPVVAPLCTITLPTEVIPMANKINYGDIVKITPILCYNSAGALADPATFTARVKAPSGVAFSLVYGIAPTVEGGDAVIRNSIGSYAVHVEMLSSRGLGQFGYSIVTTGNKAAEGAQFLAVELPA
jgi:hypothetical protein